MTERLVDQQTNHLISGEDDEIRKYERLRNARQRIDFFQQQIERKTLEPFRSRVQALIARIRNLNDKRDNIIHRLWGGGMQAGTWSAENYDSTDAALLRQDGDPYTGKSTDARANIRWALTFQGLKKIASEMATLNRDFFMTFFHS